MLKLHPQMCVPVLLLLLIHKTQTLHNLLVWIHKNQIPIISRNQIFHQPCRDCINILIILIEDSATLHLGIIVLIATFLHAKQQLRSIDGKVLDQYPLSRLIVNKLIIVQCNICVNPQGHLINVFCSLYNSTILITPFDA
jgi:hypothetical protein